MYSTTTNVAYRMAHMYTRATSFYAEGLGNISPNGKWAVFSSDWGGTSRVDVFLVPLPFTSLVQAATPTFSPVAGNYSSAQSVTISTSSSGAIICWNISGSPATNGSTGCTAGLLYTGAISVSSAETIYAVAGGTGYADSTVGSAAYTFRPAATAPTFLAYAKEATPGTQSVTMSTISSGAVICYTTNGTNPATNGASACTTGTFYSGAVSVSTTQTIKAIAGELGLFGFQRYDRNLHDQYPKRFRQLSRPRPACNGATHNRSTLDPTASSGAVICYSTSVTPATNGTTGCTTGILYSGAISPRSRARKRSRQWLAEPGMSIPRLRPELIRSARPRNPASRQPREPTPHYAVSDDHRGIRACHLLVHDKHGSRNERLKRMHHGHAVLRDDHRGVQHDDLRSRGWAWIRGQLCGQRGICD